VFLLMTENTVSLVVARLGWSGRLVPAAEVTLENTGRR
jgi:hypothetical protein